jgi:hypothetical protein
MTRPDLFSYDGLDLHRRFLRRYAFMWRSSSRYVPPQYRYMVVLLANDWHTKGWQAYISVVEYP